MQKMFYKHLLSFTAYVCSNSPILFDSVRSVNVHRCTNTKPCSSHMRCVSVDTARWTQQKTHGVNEGASYIGEANAGINNVCES